MSTKQKIVAVLLAVFFPGMGFLYVVKPFLAVGYFFADIIISILTISSVMRDIVFGFSIICSGIFLYVANVVLTFIFARKQKSCNDFNSKIIYYIILLLLIMIFRYLSHSIIYDNALYRLEKGKGHSMEPTFRKGDVYLSCYDYRKIELDRCNIVILKDFSSLLEVSIMKRIVAIPGDTVILKDKYTLVNGYPTCCIEQNIPHDFNIPRLDPRYRHFIIDQDHVFVLGDNIDESFDSRYFGQVEKRSIIGKPLYRIWPPGRIGYLDDN